MGGDSKWLTTMTTTDQTGEQRQVKVEAWTRAEIVYNILCDVSGAAPTYDKFIKWYCYPSTSITMTTLAGNLELQRQMLPLQNHVDRQLFNSRVQCVLEVFSINLVIYIFNIYDLIQCVIFYYNTILCLSTDWILICSNVNNSEIIGAEDNIFLIDDVCKI